jgi:hypothetical protein
MVNSGKGFYFDCPPIDYKFKEQHHKVYFKDVATKDGIYVKSQIEIIMERLRGKTAKEI